MKRSYIGAIMLVFLVFISACTTDDVVLEDANPNTQDLYEIKDVAFGEYLVYNSSSAQTNAARRLVPGTAFEKEGRFYINKVLTAQAKTLYITKSSAAMKAMAELGLPYANVKIADADGLQYFTGLNELQASSNQFRNALDLSALTELETLTANASYLATLDLSHNSRLKSLSFNGTTQGDRETNTLSTLDLSHNPLLETVSLTNNNFAQTGSLTGLEVLNDLKSLDLTGNSGAPIAIPDALFNRLGSAAKGVMKESDLIPVEPDYDPNDPADWHELQDKALAWYLIYRGDVKEIYTDAAQSTLAPQEGDVEAGTAFYIANGTDTVFYLRKTLAAQARVLNIAKSSAAINQLKYNNQPYAAVKIANPDGLQFFTGLTDLTASSNQFTSVDYAVNPQPVVTIDFSGMKDLKNLTLNTCYLTVLDLSACSLLETLTCTGTAQGSKEKNTLREVKLNGANLVSLNLSKNNLTRAGVAGLMSLQSPPLTAIDMSLNNESDFVIPYNVFHSSTLKTNKGTVASQQ